MLSSTTVPENARAVAVDTVEISTKGVWHRVPVLNVNGKEIITDGRWIKRAFVHDEEWAENDLEDPELCVSRLKDRASRRLRADIFTFSQKPYKPDPQYPYHKEWDSVAVLPISTFQKWWDDLPQEGRKNVRRAQKRGVVVKVEQLHDDLVREIVKVNNDSPVRQGKHFYHYGKSFDQVKKDQSTYYGRCDFVCAYLESELIGFIKVVYRGDMAAILQILPKASHHDLRPINALLAKTVEICAAKGMSCLTYGLFNYGTQRDSSLREFKTRNGFEEVLVPRFYIPLTAKGALGLRANLHHGWRGCSLRRCLHWALALERDGTILSCGLAGVAQR